LEKAVLDVKIYVDFIMKMIIVIAIVSVQNTKIAVKISKLLVLREVLDVATSVVE